MIFSSYIAYFCFLSSGQTSFSIQENLNSGYFLIHFQNNLRQIVTLYHTSLGRSFSRFPSGKYSGRRSARLLQTVRPHTCLQGNPLPPESDNLCRLYCCRYDDGRSDTVPVRKLLRKNQDLPAAFRQWPGLLFPVIIRYSFRIFLHTDGCRYRESVLLSPK